MEFRGSSWGPLWPTADDNNLPHFQSVCVLTELLWQAPAARHGSVPHHRGGTGATDGLLSWYPRRGGAGGGRRRRKRRVEGLWLRACMCEGQHAVPPNWTMRFDGAFNWHKKRRIMRCFNAPSSFSLYAPAFVGGAPWTHQRSGGKHARHKSIINYGPDLRIVRPV